MSKEKNHLRMLEIVRGIKDGKSGVDRDYEDEGHLGAIYGIAVMTNGNVKDDRGWEIDDQTLEQIVSAGKEHANMGLKSRFGHPNMSMTALGTFVGRMKNFRKDGDIARADLYLSRTAYETPDGDLASYVMELAEKDPDAFGTSVVLGDFELEYRLEKNGTAKKDKDGKELPPILRVKSLMAVDVVDDPAANNGMFGKFFNESVELSAKATEFMDRLLSSPEAVERVMAFFDRYKANRVDIDMGKKETATKKEEVSKMEGKDLTIEFLTKERPDLVEMLKKDGNKEGVTGERARVLSIVKSTHTEFKDMGMEPLLVESVEKGLTLEGALSSMRGKRLADLQAKSNTPPGADAADAGKKSHLDRAKEYQKEHGGTITDALSATAEKRAAQK
jgi:hypothetical protein